MAVTQPGCPMIERAAESWGTHWLVSRQIFGKPALVLGSWGNIMREVVNNKKSCGKGAVRLPKILVLTCLHDAGTATAC